MNSAIAQRTDSSRAGVRPPARATQQALPDSVTGPPISPRRAFLYSVLIPGYGQTRLGRGTAAAVFAIVEVGSIGFARKAAQDLREARNTPQDSVIAGYQTDPATGLIARDPATGLPIPSGYITGRFSSDRIKARRLHYEDWIAAIIFNHLFSGADAYVAANLWDFRTNVSVDPRTRRTTIGASVSY